jgi:hypothetical protein
MRENRPYGLEVGESGSTGLPYPYRRAERLYSVDHPFIFTINENGNVCFLFEFGYFCLRADVRQC